MTSYEKCAHCWHFIEPNDAEPSRKQMPEPVNIFTADLGILYALLDQAERDGDWAAIEEIHTELENRGIEEA